MDDDEEAAKAFAEVARSSLTNYLRYQYPFMKTALVNTAVDGAIMAINKEVEAAKPQMAASKSRIDFFSLPAEIRNYIYDLALPQHEDRPRVAFDERRKKRWDLNVPSYPPRQMVGGARRVGFPGLLHTSRQTRAEALPVFLSRVEVIVGIDSFMPDPRLGPDMKAPICKAWLRELGKERAKLVKHFVLAAEEMTRSQVTNKKIFKHLGFHEFGLRKDAVKVWEYRNTGCLVGWRPRGRYW